MYPRKQILPDDSYSHVFFRCHNQQFLFKNDDIKQYIISLWVKYKSKYQIKVFEFNILDNHAHMLVKAKNADFLGHFMRTVNSQIARYVNNKANRDSQVIRDRYKSPLITDFNYFKNTMQYVWLNKQKATGQSALTDPYCSLSWRVNPDIVKKFSHSEEELVLLNNFLDKDEGIYPTSERERRHFIHDLFNEALSLLKKFTEEIFTNIHTIGDKMVVERRSDFLSSFLKEKLASSA